MARIYIFWTMPILVFNPVANLMHHPLLTSLHIVWVKMNDNNNCQFHDPFCQFFANYMSIFHKIEVQTFILGCLTVLKSKWFKGYDTKCKYIYFWFFAILYKNTLLHFLHFFILCHNFCTNQDSDSLSTSKYLPESHFCQRKPYSWQKKWLDTVVKCSS